MPICPISSILFFAYTYMIFLQEKKNSANSTFGILIGRKICNFATLILSKMEKRIADLDKNELDYADNELFVIKETGRIPEQLVNAMLDMELLLFCAQGRASFSLQEQQINLSAGQCALCPDFTPIHDLMVSPDLRLCIIGFSWHLIEEVPALVKQAWSASSDLLRQPVFTPNENERKRIKQYRSLLLHHVENPNSRFRKEVVQLLVQTFIFELINMTRTGKDRKDEQSANVPQRVLITRQFFELLAHHEGTIRSVAQMARMMNITPKYLSHVISSKTGHPPIYHIHQYTVRAIERRLRYSDLTIKEIAMRMGFPSLAFFGKFVKTHLGVSPKAYRAKNISNGITSR